MTDRTDGGASGTATEAAVAKEPARPVASSTASEGDAASCAAQDAGEGKAKAVLCGGGDAPTKGKLSGGDEPPSAGGGAKGKRRKAAEEQGAQAGDKPEQKQQKDPEYRAAAVVFFTRKTSGDVAHVLVAVEERQVQARFLGLQQSGKVTRPMIVFPMGRREKKDKTDAVETAKREYIEETSDFGGLSEYLAVADFSDGVGEGGPSHRNLAVLFAPASMIVLFCEVPVKAANLSGEPPAKKPKLAETPPKPKPSPTYHPGKTDHLQPAWVDAEELRSALATRDGLPEICVNATSHKIFPMVMSILRVPDVREWLGVPLPSAKDNIASEAAGVATAAHAPSSEATVVVPAASDEPSKNNVS
eukprot:NODE_9683_length_1406_cov_4.855356.p1 GENE.NODE_9683_length_1406_cov_4.855356~~NODE_9683_length_1406_cov_4.855356.p1  ORF type:complete len:360 (+),score=107.69 NODE_9683_length_1406_cov_4.855356:313-1392(+)